MSARTSHWSDRVHKVYDPNAPEPDPPPPEVGSPEWTENGLNSPEPLYP